MRSLKISALFATGCVANLLNSSVITPELSEFIEGLLVNETVPGISLGVVRPDGEVEFGAWGIMTEDGKNATQDTLYGLASCSKAFLSASLGILMDDFARGKNATALPLRLEVFDWETKVKDLLPDDWKLMDEWADLRANILDILSHVSGIARHDFSYGPKDTPLDVVRHLRHLRPSFELREQWSYNNQPYMLVSHIISIYSGMPYTDFVKTRIFTPLNMSSTTFSESEALRSGMLTQAFAVDGRRLPYWFPDNVSELVAGPMGIISNVVDMIKWTKVLVNLGTDPTTNTIIIPRSAFDEVTTSYTIQSGKLLDEFTSALSSERLQPFALVN